MALLLDVLAALALSGRLMAGRVAVVVLAALTVPQNARADDTFAVMATSEVVLAYVVTGNAQIDDTSHAGLLGL